MTKTYVLTGSTSGIGLALLNVISGNNIVFAGYRDEKKCEYLGFYKNNNIIPFYIDMTDYKSVVNAANFIKSKTDKIDTLVNAAGCVIAGAIQEININDIKSQFEVNTFSHLNFTQELLPLLKNGKIINVSSMASFGMFPFIAPYCASKRALDILFNSLGLENKYNIKYISIKPGAIATPLWEKSVNQNQKTLQKNEIYKKEYEYLVNNARKNEKYGLSVDKVTQVILNADKSKRPKSSYTIGFDAKCAEILSFLPQNLVNKIIKLGMNLKFKSK